MLHVRVVGLGNTVKTSVLRTAIFVQIQKPAKVVKLAFMGTFVIFLAQLNVKIVIGLVTVKHV